VAYSFCFLSVFSVAKKLFTRRKHFGKTADNYHRSKQFGKSGLKSSWLKATKLEKQNDFLTAEETSKQWDT
jgi:hypothetical protein